MSRGPVLIVSIVLVCLIISTFDVQPAKAEDVIIVDGSLSDWIDLGISPLGIDPDDQWAGYADLRKLWAYIGDTDLYLAIQVDWEYPVDYGLVIFSILIAPENSSSWYEVIWGNYSYSILLGHGEAHGEVQNITSATGWDGVLEFSVPLSFMDSPKVMTLEVDSYSPDWMYNIDIMPAPWEEPYRIPEYSSFLILTVFMIATLLAVIVYKRKHTV
jgi:hypothetical protein